MSYLNENNFLVDVLKKLDFSTDNTETHYPEIVFTKNSLQNLHPKHFIALEFAEILEADAVYFKYYEDNRFCTPQVYFYDNSSGIYNKIKIAEIHRNIYSSNQVALMVLIDKTSIKFFDTKQPIEEINNIISNKNCLIKESELLENKLKILKLFFNAKKLNSGLFWENNENSKHFLKNTSAYEKLVDILNQIKFAFIQDFTSNGLKKDFAENLLFKCILIKYLEENGLEYAKKFYKKNKIGYSSLNEILSNKKILNLFAALENHFNGEVFEILPSDENGNIDLIEKEKRETYLKENSLLTLAEHLDGYLDKGNQKSLWQEYSFKHMPIELISNFYEEFIKKEKDKNKGTVYTPSYLVNLLVDECLPISTKKEHLNENIKLADVSCGSGIFITTAFKRLVQRLRVKKWVEEGKPNHLPKPSLKEVKAILKNNIFGVDLHPTAVKLTKFSLQLGLCQLVPNHELWTWNEDRVFKNLENENVFQEDFFDFLTEDKYHQFHESFDLIIGNPPFFKINESKSNPEYSTITKKLEQKINFEFSVKIPGNELALMFLESSSILLKPKGDLCLIQKSTSLLYNKSKGAKNFRDSLFNQFHVHQIIDFTLLKNHLYKSKIKPLLDDFGKPLLDNKGKRKKSKSTAVESCAVFYKKEKIENYNTLHIVSRLLKNTKDGLSFEFDYYDFYEIEKTTAINNNSIWRCNLLGGNRLNHLINKLEENNSNQIRLKDFLFSKLKISKTNYRSGFKIGNKTKSASYITKNNVLLGKNFDSNKFAFSEFSDTQKFESPRTEDFFKSPFLIIKSTITDNKIPIKLNENKDFSFDINIIGISDSKTEGLKKLNQILQNNQRVNVLKSLSSCSQFYIGSTTAIQKQDIDNWTIPLESDEIQISFSEKIIMDDVLDYMYPSWYERNPKIYDEANIVKIKEFADIFNQSFNSIYKKDNKEQRLRKVFSGSDFYALEFYYSNESYETKFKENADFEIEDIIKNNISSNAIVNRVLKIYGENTITLIKPKNLRYWLKSIALRDADDVFNDMIKNGY